MKWWHRIAARQDWHLQGWQRARVYPDFLVCVRDAGHGVMRLAVLETKGLHLAGSADTEYKRRLLELLTEYSASATPVGELKLEYQRQVLRFELLLEDTWRQALARGLAPGR